LSAGLDLLLETHRVKRRDEAKNETEREHIDEPHLRTQQAKNLEQRGPSGDNKQTAARTNCNAKAKTENRKQKTNKTERTRELYLRTRQTETCSYAPQTKMSEEADELTHAAPPPRANRGGNAPNHEQPETPKS